MRNSLKKYITELVGSFWAFLMHNIIMLTRTTLVELILVHFMVSCAYFLDSVMVKLCTLCTI